MSGPAATLGRDGLWFKVVMAMIAVLTISSAGIGVYASLTSKLAVLTQRVDQETKGYQIVVQTLVTEFRSDIKTIRKEMNTEFRELNKRLARIEGQVGQR